MKELSDKRICSIINSGYNGNVKYWEDACEEAERRKIYFKQYDKPKPIVIVPTIEVRYDGNPLKFDWMIFWMCLGFAISFILGYIACLIRSL